MKVKGTATVCDICGATGNFVPRGEDDIEPALGLHIQRGQVHTGAGGGPLPNDTFVCIECLTGNEENGGTPVSAWDVANLVWGKD